MIEDITYISMKNNKFIRDYKRRTNSYGNSLYILRHLDSCPSELNEKMLVYVSICANTREYNDHNNCSIFNMRKIS